MEETSPDILRAISDVPPETMARVARQLTILQWSDADAETRSLTTRLSETATRLRNSATHYLEDPAEATARGAEFHNILSQLETRLNSLVPEPDNDTFHRVIAQAFPVFEGEGAAVSDPEPVSLAAPRAVRAPVSYGAIFPDIDEEPEDVEQVQMTLDDFVDEMLVGNGRELTFENRRTMRIQVVNDYVDEMLAELSYEPTHENRQIMLTQFFRGEGGISDPGFANAMQASLASSEMRRKETMLALVDEPIEQPGPDDTCAICFDAYDPQCMVVRLPCSHFYHSACIREWGCHKPTCPVCRSPIPVV